MDSAVETLMMIDSLQMTDADRLLILERCEAVAARRIVITHGTDSMEQTAAVLGRGIPLVGCCQGAEVYLDTIA